MPLRRKVVNVCPYGAKEKIVNAIDKLREEGFPFIVTRDGYLIIRRNEKEVVTVETHREFGDPVTFDIDRVFFIGFLQEVIKKLTGEYKDG